MDNVQRTSTYDFHNTVVMDILASVIMTPRQENLFESQKADLQEETFQKYPHQDGWSLQNTENYNDKLYIKNSGNCFTLENFYCIFCKDISAFRINENEEYENT